MKNPMQDQLDLYKNPVKSLQAFTKDIDSLMKQSITILSSCHPQFTRTIHSYIMAYDDGPGAGENDNNLWMTRVLH